MIFESITEWQAEDYIVLVRAGLFASHEDAEAFGQKPMTLRKDGDRLVLQNRAGEELDEAFDENIAVFKLKKLSKNMTVTTQDDYEKVNIKICEFGSYPGLSLFGLLSYGVNQADKLVICGEDGTPLTRSL